MPPRKKSSQPEWKQLLALGEALLDQPGTDEQLTLIQTAIRKMFGAQAQIWLARPFFPLPGEAEVPLMDETTPALALEVYQQRQAIQSTSLDEILPPESAASQVSYAGFPLVTQEFVLGVIVVSRAAGKPFQTAELNFLEGMAAQAALSIQISRQVVLKNWRLDQLALVRSVSTQIANVFNIPQLCQQITGLIQDSFHYYSVSIYTHQDEDQTLHLRGTASQEDSPTSNPPAAIKPGTGIIGTTYQTGNDIISQDVTHEPHYLHSDRLPQTKSEASFALKIGDAVLGVLDVQMDHINAFHEIDIMVLRALADNIALALDGSRLYTELRWHADQLEAVTEISRTLTSILDFDRLLEQVVHTIQKRFGYSYIHLFTIHPGRRKIIYAAGSGERSRNQAQKEISYNLDDPFGLIPAAARSGKTILSNDVSQDPLYRPSELPPDDTRAELVVPLSFRDEVLGILDIQSDQLNAFDPAEMALFEAIGATIAIALRNATLYRSETWRRQVADSFRDVAALLSANIALDQLLDAILVRLENNLPCDASVIWLLDDPNFTSLDDSHPLKLAAVRGAEAEKITRVLENNPDVAAWLTQAMEFSEPTIRKPEDPYGPLGAAMDFPADYSSIAVPLRSGNQLLGVLTLAHQTPGRYGSEARAMTLTFASYAAVAIQNTRLYASTQEQAWIATVLLQVAEASQSIGSVDELLETMVRLTPLLVGVNKCAFFLWNEEFQAFEISNRYGMDDLRKDAHYFDAELPAFSRLRSSQSTIFIQSALRELDLPEAEPIDSSGTLVLIPLLARGETLGAFLVSHQANNGLGTEKAFDQHTLSILQGIAHQTAVAVENIMLLETRQEEAYVTAVLLQVAQAVVSQNNLNDILDTIVHLMPILVGIDACVIYLWDRDENSFHGVQAFAGSHQIEEELIRKVYPENSFPLLDAVRSSDSLVACPQLDQEITFESWPDLTCLPPGEMPNPKPFNTQSWLLGFPLSVKGEVYGVLVTQETGTASGFHERRLELINGVAQQVALALQNERLKQEMVRTELLDNEIQLARQIQKTFLPSRLPVFPEWELDIRWETARQVGGDFYDIFKLSKGRLGMVIADVSDKGLAAALYMTVTRTLIRAYMQTIESPARVLEKVNKLLVSDAQNGMFVTAIYAVLSLETGQLTYANAGHNRPLLLRSENSQVEVLPKGGMALGVMEEIHYQDYLVDIQPCDTLLLYTDGLTEAFDPDGVTFGEERLNAVLSQAACSNVKELLTTLDARMSEFRRGTPISDDLTVVAVRRMPSA